LYDEGFRNKAETFSVLSEAVLVSTEELLDRIVAAPV
jgi:hypothetical protein